jgi:hypothetical protein
MVVSLPIPSLTKSGQINSRSYMKKFPLIALFMLTSCSTVPQIFQTAEDVFDDTAIKIEISKEAIDAKDTNWSISVTVNRS